MAIANHTTDIVGFIVVRRPHLNFDVEGRGVFRKSPPKIGTVYYGGVFRMPWFDLDEACYADKLGQEQIAARKLLKTHNEDFSGIEVCRDLQAAKSLLDASDGAKEANELIAIRSPRLIQIKGSVESSTNIVWLGYDIISLGHWSLLEAGIFVAPNYFSRWQNSINEWGLITDPSIVQEYANTYNSAAAKRAVEDLPESVYGLDAVQVGNIP